MATLKSKPAAGRPSREQAEARHGQLLDTALDLFLEHGFEGTTIDTIAAAVGMTKRTIYARYDDKAALFRAALDRAARAYAIPMEDVRTVESEDLEATLIAVAKLRLANLMRADGLKLQRVLSAEGYRFPDIQDAFYQTAAKPTVEFLADLLTRRTDAGADANRAALAFMSLVIGGPARALVAGSGIAEADLDAHIRFSVRLFLNGVGYPKS